MEFMLDMFRLFQFPNRLTYDPTQKSTFRIFKVERILALMI